MCPLVLVFARLAKAPLACSFRSRVADLTSRYCVKRCKLTGEHVVFLEAWTPTHAGHGGRPLQNHEANTSNPQLTRDQRIGALRQVDATDAAGKLFFENLVVAQPPVAGLRLVGPEVGVDIGYDEQAERGYTAAASRSKFETAEERGTSRQACGEGYPKKIRHEGDKKGYETTRTALTATSRPWTDVCRGVGDGFTSVYPEKHDLKRPQLGRHPNVEVRPLKVNGCT